MGEKISVITVVNIIVCFVFCFCSFSKGQQSGSFDTSIGHLSQIKYDTAYVSALLNEGQEYLYDSTELARTNIQKAISLSDSLNYASGLARANALSGKILFSQNKFKKAVDYFTSALEHYETNPNPGELIDLYRYLASSYYQLDYYNKMIFYADKGYEISLSVDDYEQQINFLVSKASGQNSIGESKNALECLYKAADIAELHKLIKSKTELLFTTGLVYDNLEEYDLAIEAYKEALDIFTEIGDSSAISTANNNLGVSYSNKGEYEKSFLYFFEALQIDIELNDRYGVASEYNNIGDIYRQIENYTLAKEYFDKALKIVIETNDIDLQVIVYYNLALISHDQKKFKQSLDFVLKSLEIAKHIGHLEDIMDCLELAFQNYSSLKKYKLAFEYSNEYHQMYDSLLNVAKAKEIINIRAKYENKQKEQIINELEEKTKYQNTIKNYLLLILSIGALLLVSIIILYFFTRNSSRKIKKQKNYFDTLLENSQDFIAVLDDNAHILYLSPSYEKKFNRTVQERMYQSAYDFIHPDDVPVLKSNLEQVRLEKKPVVFEFRIRDAHDNWISVAAHGLNLLDNKNINGTIINFWDITKRKEYEQELNKANETKNKLFSIISHDLRGHIGTSKNVIDFILDEKDEIDKAGIIKLLSPMHKSSESLVLLLDNLLTWARSQLKKINYNPNTNELTPLIIENIELFRRIAENKSIAVNIVDGNNLHACFDKDLIDFVIRNLLLNAIKYSFENSIITFELKNIEDCIQCAVHDTGTGMSKERISSLFQDTFPESMPGTNKEKGSGLGLILCKEFVEQNKGKIWVESEQGKGSSFYFTLPESCITETALFNKSND